MYIIERFLKKDHVKHSNTKNNKGSPVYIYMYCNSKLAEC